MGDAPRHKSASRRTFKIGRGASRTACDAGAPHDSSRSSFRTLQRGNAVHDALRRQEDAERPE
ncbi:hypothetical protein CVE34_03895, partial [Pseudomonas syringae pv. actinidiae]|nr:hypothetical protein [Pseudomonas syringae pv. actinidiae]